MSLDRTNRVTLLLTDKEHQILTTNAQKYGMSMSQYIRNKTLNSKFKTVIE